MKQQKKCALLFLCMDIKRHGKGGEHYSSACSDTVTHDYTQEQTNRTIWVYEHVVAKDALFTKEQK